MNFQPLFHSPGVASLAALVFAMPACLGAQTTIAQANITTYYNSSYGLYALNGGTSYVNSGDVNFGTTNSGDNLAIGLTTTNNFLTISSGTVTDYFGFIGYGSSGTVTVTGAGSTWTNTDLLYVGYHGTGTLNIENGGKVKDTTGYIGVYSNITGTVTVKDAGSSLTNSSELYVGLYGTGTLTIENGGKVSNTIGRIGFYLGSTGTVTVTGANSEWTNSSELYVGLYDRGTLTIENGGKVSNSSTGYIGFGNGGNGTVTVTGGGSAWTNSGSLNVGYGNNGTGTLKIENGGTVSSNYGYIGFESSSHGTATVTGANSTWTNTYALYAGFGGTGTFNIEKGGKVSSLGGIIGYQSGSHGTVTINGAGSSWTNSSDLYVGYNGSGTLKIENGGTFSNLYIGNIGYLSGSHGAVTVTGAGSSWTNSADLYVGRSGTGTLNIENGALVTASTVSVGSGSAIYLGGGYLALAGTGSTDSTNLTALLDGGTKVYAWNGTAYVLITSSSSALISCNYYLDITTYDALDGYGLSGSYTILTSLYSVPEPSTYALFGGLGALGLVLLRRKRK